MLAMRRLASEWRVHLKLEEDQLVATTGLLTLQVSGIAPERSRDAVQTSSCTDNALHLKTLASSILSARYVGYVQVHTN
jgi:hypothetical protein